MSLSLYFLTIILTLTVLVFVHIWFSFCPCLVWLQITSVFACVLTTFLDFPFRLLAILCLSIHLCWHPTKVSLLKPEWWNIIRRLQVQILMMPQPSMGRSTREQKYTYLCAEGDRQCCLLIAFSCNVMYHEQQFEKMWCWFIVFTCHVIEESCLVGENWKVNKLVRKWGKSKTTIITC